MSSIKQFLRSKPGSGFIKFALFSTLLAAGVGYGTYSLNLRWYVASKGEEKTTALQLVDAFVTNYSEIRGRFDSDKVPVPATFRAHSIELFNHMRDADTVLRLQWVGRSGRAIATPPADTAMAATIESFEGEANPTARSSILTVGNDLVFRTVYPSTATQQSCVDCHNRLQPDKPQWQLNDVMGAFSIDVPAGPFLRTNLMQSVGLSLALSLGLSSVGFFVAVQSFRATEEREAAQARLKESEQRFRAFAESASDWFWEQDEQLRFTYVSDPVEKSGVPIRAHIGKTRREIVSMGVTEEQWQAHQADVDARRSFQNFRFVRFTLSGDARHISVSGKPIFDDVGRFLGYRGTAKDVTAEVAGEIELARHVEARTAELRAAQDELIRKERLSVLGQLTATVAHELRNPLSTIRNSLFAVKEGMAARGVTLAHAFERIERGITRCDRIVADLIDYARARDPRFEWVVVDDWLGKLLDEQSLPGKVAIKRDLATSRVRLLIDPERLRRAVVNLIDNAVQALPELSADRPADHIVVNTRTVGRHVQISIDDTGCGIPAEILPKVFEPLFSTRTFGTGLGLATVKQIVEQHRGSVEITSEPGRGTRVIVKLPLPPAQGLAA
jgi:PAS domain S-box-containing protein